MKSVDERIAALEARAASLKARKKKADRAEETRRKILLGAWILHTIDTQTGISEKLLAFLAKELPGFLKRDSDKALFAALLSEGSAEQSQKASQPAPPPQTAKREDAPVATANPVAQPSPRPEARAFAPAPWNNLTGGAR